MTTTRTWKHDFAVSVSNVDVGCAIFVLLFSLSLSIYRLMVICSCMRLHNREIFKIVRVYSTRPLMKIVLLFHQYFSFVDVDLCDMNFQWKLLADVNGFLPNRKFYWRVLNTCLWVECRVVDTNDTLYAIVPCVPCRFAPHTYSIHTQLTKYLFAVRLSALYELVCAKQNHFIHA